LRREIDALSLASHLQRKKVSGAFVHSRPKATSIIVCRSARTPTKNPPMTARKASRAPGFKGYREGIDVAAFLDSVFFHRIRTGHARRFSLGLRCVSRRGFVAFLHGIFISAFTPGYALGLLLIVILDARPRLPSRAASSMRSFL